MSTWGDVAGSRNQQDIGDYDHSGGNSQKTSIHDWDNQQDYAQWQNDRQDQQDDAKHSWGGDDPDRWGFDQQEQEPPEQKRGPGSRGGTPGEFKHAQQRNEFLGRDTRGAKKKLKQARHPIQTGTKAAKKKAKKSRWWPGTQSHSFHNPNGSR